MLDKWQEMKEKYENNEIAKEVLQDWKANYPDSLKKDYVLKKAISSALITLCQSKFHQKKINTEKAHS